MVRCALLIALVGASFAGCSRSQPTAEPEATAAADTAPQEERDFRGINWGDSLEMVAVSESKRSKVIDAGYRYATQLSGNPAVVSYGYAGDRVAAAAYSFPWTGDTKYCTAGSQCSLRSAGYAAEVCREMSRLLSEKYQVSGENATRSILSAEALDRQLARRDEGIDIAYKHWGSSRALIALFIMRPRGDQGWLCKIRYRPPDDVLQRITAEVDEVAKRDL